MCVGYFWSGEGRILYGARGQSHVLQSHCPSTIQSRALWLLDGKGETPINVWGTMQYKGEFTGVIQNGAILSVKKELAR